MRTHLLSLVTYRMSVRLFCVSLTGGMIYADTSKKGYVEGRPYAVVQDQGKRPHMEDTYLVITGDMGHGKGRPDDICKIYAVFDGHGADAVSTFLAREMFLLLDYFDFIYLKGADSKEIFGLSSVETLTPTLLLKVKKSIRDGYRDIDKRICERQAVQKMDKGGSTAIMVVELKGYCFCVNLGDSRSAAFALSDSSMPLLWVSEDHKPAHPEERGRIEQFGGTVKGRRTPRVNGRLALSRAFGDSYLKQYPQPWHHDHVVSPVPDIQVVRKEPMVVILASDGLWDVLTVEEVHGVFKEAGISSHTTAEELARVAACLLQRAQRKVGGLTPDNITVMLALI